MKKSEAKRVAIGLVVADLSANLGADAWRAQGLLGEYDEADQERIVAAAYDFQAELYRRLARGDR